MFITTHDGQFDTDDVAAVATLRLAGYSERNFRIRRTRNSQVIAESEFVIDVGLVYDHSLRRYDHHQKGGAGTRENGVPYASFGLVWKHYGVMAIVNVLEYYLPKQIRSQINFDVLLNKVFLLVDANLVQGVDARDCGVKTHIGINGASPYTISDAISAWNVPWYMSELDKRDNGLFSGAVVRFQEVLSNEIKSQTGNALAEHNARIMIENQKENKILILDQFVPWSNYVAEHCPRALYVIFPDQSGSFRVQAVPVGVGKESFELKAPLPENWRGKSPQELIGLTSCEDVTFVHNAGFIMGCKTLDGAKHCAELAVQLYELANNLR